MKKRNIAFGVGAALIGTMIGIERCLGKKEIKQIKEYGTKIESGHGRMNTLVLGEGDETIVLLSGYGTASPILDFKPLAQKLAVSFRVVILEYLGYGCSEDTTLNRSVENICSEIHSVMKRLKVEHFWLMPHSISGVYALAYANLYPEELDGVLAIDTSIPEQTDYMSASFDIYFSKLLDWLSLTRPLLKLKPQMFLPEEGVYEKEDRKQMKLRLMRHGTSKAIANEGKQINKNMLQCRLLSFPKDLPVLMFVSDGNIKMTKGWWQTLHEKQIASLTNKEMKILKGSHYLHWSNSDIMAEEAKRFIQNHLIKRNA